MPDGTRGIEVVEKVFATATSITIGLSNDRQITFQSGFEGDETDAVVNARFDRMMAFADRQKARYQIPEIEEELFKHRETLANFIEDRDRIELEHTRAQAARSVEIKELERLRDPERKRVQGEIDATILKIQERRNEENAAGAEDWRRHGKAGLYKPAGARAANIKHCDEALAKAKEHRELALDMFEQDWDAKIAAVQAEINKADAERDQYLRNQQISIDRYKVAIAEREEKLARCKALLEG